MGSYKGILDYKKTSKSMILVSIVASILVLSSLPLNLVAGEVSITVDTDRNVYLPGQVLRIFGHATVDALPLEEAWVYITIRYAGQQVWSTTTTTDSSGFYLVEQEVAPDAARGEYQVVANVSFTDEYGHIEIAGDSSEFEVAEPTPEEVTVSAYDSAENPIADANVVLYDHITSEWCNSTLTSATGVAVLAIPAMRTFDVLIYKTGYGKLLDGRMRGFLFDDNASNGYAAPCELNFSLVTLGQGILSGTAVNATDNAPLEGATVSALAYVRGKTYWVSSTTTSTDGSYSIDLNVGLWRIWIDKRVDGNLTHLGTWSEVLMTSGASETWNVSLWAKAQLSVEGVWVEGSLADWATVVLINDTYGGVLWRTEFSSNDFSQGEPIDFDMPAVDGLLVVICKTQAGPGEPDRRYVYSETVRAQKGSTITLNATLSENEYEMWSFPNDWQPERLLGNLTMVAYVVDPETARPDGKAGPVQFVDPDGDLYYYLMLDRGYATPTIWQTRAIATRTDTGSFYQFFDLDALDAPEGYYLILPLIRNSSGDVIAAGYDWSNRFRYQIQLLQVKGTYDVGEDVEVRFKVYDNSGYTDDAEVTYGLFDSSLGWRLVRGGVATVNSTTKVWNVTLPSDIFGPREYSLGVKVVGGREQTFMFRVQDYMPIMFAGQILANASIDLWSQQYNRFVVTANETGSFNVTLPPADYDAWFNYDNKDTPGMDARDTWMRLYLYSNVYDFPNGGMFWEYQGRPVREAFEVRGIVFGDANRNGIFDDGESRLVNVNVRAAQLSGMEQWIPPTFPDGSYRIFLEPGEIQRLKATKSIYSQNETATPEVGATASQGDLVRVNIPMVLLGSGNITGFVKLDNGTLLENVGLHFMDEYWSWLGSIFTNSSGGYLFTAPASRKLNIWVDPQRSGISGKPLNGLTVAEGYTLYLNVTLYESTRMNGTILMNGVETWAQIMPLDEDWNRVWWDWGEHGYFECDVPKSTKKLLLWAWGTGFLIQDVNLQSGRTNSLGDLNLIPLDQNISVNGHPLNWEWQWSLGRYVNFTVELRDQVNYWAPVSGANVTFWAWNWNDGTLVGHGTAIESDPLMAPGIYEEAFLPTSAGHYKVLILANVSGNRIVFTDFWLSVTDKKLFLLETSGQYALDAVQAGNAKVRVRLLNTDDSSPISGYNVWYEIRGFTDIQKWYMETVVTRTSASDLGNGFYEVTLPSLLDAGSYWMDIAAGDWESSQNVGFEITEDPVQTANIYGWVTRSPTPVDGATIEAWMEAQPYRYVTTTDADGYYSLIVPQKHAYHLHIFWDNATTTGIDYTTVPEWERIEVKVINTLHNASISRVEQVSLTINQEDLQGIPQPVNAEVLVWDMSTTPPRLRMWAGTWRGPGLFEEKITEGTYVFEIRPWGWPQWHYWSDPQTVSAEPPADSFELTPPIYDSVVDVGADTGSSWRVKPGDNLTIHISDGNLQWSGLNASYLYNSCEKRFEVFQWVPGKMAEAYMFDATWELKRNEGQGFAEDYLEMNFTIPSYFTGGDVELQMFFYNGSDEASPKVFVTARSHLMIAPLDLGLTVVPYSATINDTVMAVAAVIHRGVPASGVEIAFEVYDNQWQIVTIEAGEEVSPGVYVATFTIPEGSYAGWWTVKAIAVIGAKEATAYVGFDVRPG